MASRNRGRERRSVTFPHIMWWFSRPRMSYSGEAERKRETEGEMRLRPERERERETRERRADIFDWYRQPQSQERVPKSQSAV
jgi:hypothetical protein